MPEFEIGDLDFDDDDFIRQLEDVRKELEVLVANDVSQVIVQTDIEIDESQSGSSWWDTAC